MIMDSSSLQPDTGARAGSRWAERLILLLIVGLYLWIFTPDNPNGDGWVYINGVDSGAVSWNPNHLYMQPTGLLFSRLVGALGLGWSTFTTLKVLSALASIAAILLFHTTLAGLWPGAVVARLAASLGLFFSAHFLSMSLAEEFYIIQLPVLCGVLLAAVCWIDRRERWLLITMGALLALVTAIQINNAVLAIAIGLWVAFESRADGSRALADGGAVWLPGLLLGLPLVLVPFAISAHDQGLVGWLTSYQGRGDNALRSLYGLQLTPAGIVKSLATLAYGFAISVVGLGDLGTYGETLLTGRALEFRPVYWALGATGALFACVGLGTIALLVWWLRTGRRDPLGRLGLVWIGSYLVFNFLWVDTSDQFWGPLLPALWLLAVAALLGVGRAAAGSFAAAGSSVRSRGVLVLVTVSLLLAGANTASVAGHRAFVRTEENRARLLQLLQPGDLVVTTGWDDLVWLSWDPQAPYERVALMELALKSKGDDGPLAALPERVRTHLASGRRVIVGRVFERDREARPWEQLARLRWPRPRIVELLKDFDRREIGVVGGVHFHELTARAAPGGK